MANIDPNNALAQLTSSLRQARNDISGDGVGTRLSRAIQDNIAITGVLQNARERLAFNREAEILRLREQLKAEAEQAKAEAEQNQRVVGVLAQADSNFLSGRSSEERNALRGTPFELAYREREIENLISEAASRDLTEPANLASLAAAQQAAEQVRANRISQGVSDEALQQFRIGSNFDEIYENRNSSDFNPLSIARNVAGSAVAGLTGLADLGLSSVGAGAIGEPIGAIGQAAGRLIDDQGIGSGIFKQRLANAPEGQGFVESARGALDALTPGAAAGLGADLLGLLVAGGPVTSAARAAGRALGAGQNAARAGQVLQRGGTPALAAGAGQDFANSGIEDDNTGRTAQALTQLLGTLGLGATAGAGIPVLSNLVGGVERAAAQGGVRSVLGGNLGTRTPIAGSGFGNTARNVAADIGQRAGAGGVGAVRQGVSEGTQEGLEALISQAALGVGTGQNQFNVDQLGQSVALGAALGGGLGAGRAFQTRQPDPAAVQAQPVSAVASPAQQAAPLSLPAPQLALPAPPPTPLALPTPPPFPASRAQNGFSTPITGTQVTPLDESFLPTLTNPVQPQSPGLSTPITGTQVTPLDESFLPTLTNPVRAPQILPDDAFIQPVPQAPAIQTDITGTEAPNLGPPDIASLERFAGTDADTDVSVTDEQSELPTTETTVPVSELPADTVQTERLAMVKRNNEVYTNGTLRGTNLLLGTRQIQPDGSSGGTVPGLVNRGRGSAAGSFAIGLIDPSQPEVFAYEPQDSTTVSGPALLRRINNQISEGSLDPELSDVFARAQNPRPAEQEAQSVEVRRDEPLSDSPTDAPFDPVGRQEVTTELEAERITINDLYDSITGRDVPRAIRQAEALVREGEYTIEDMRDAAYSTDNPQIQAAFTRRVEKLEQQLASERGAGTDSNLSSGPATRASITQLTQRRDSLISQIEQAQAQQQFDQVPPLQQELQSINETLQEQQVLDQESVRRIVDNESVSTRNGVPPGESEAAALRGSFATGRAAPDRRVIDRLGPDVPVRGGRTSPSPRMRSVRGSNPDVSTGVGTVPQEDGSRPVDSEPVARMSAAAIRSRASKLLGSFPFEVVNTASDLTPEFQQKLIDDTGYAWDEGVKAVIYGNTVYLNAQSITDQADLDVSLAHEIMGHAGLRARHGPKLDPYLNAVITSYGSLEDMLRAADRLGLSSIRTDYANMINRARNEGSLGPASRVVAEEVLASLAERGGMDPQRANILSRMGAVVKSWLRAKFPKLADVLGASMADWELALMASEASYAGRRLLDAAQDVDVPRVYAARREPLAERMRAQATKIGNEAFETAENFINGQAPLNQRTAGLADNIRQAGRDARENNENAYNKFVLQHVNNRRPLQNFTRKMRRLFAADRNLVRAAVEGINNAANGTRVSFGSVNVSQKLAIADKVFKDLLGPGLDPTARAELIQDRMALYESTQLSESKAEKDHNVATQEMRGDLEAGFSLLSQAMPGRVDQRAAYEFYDGVRRDRHAIERNEALFFDQAKNKAIYKFIRKDKKKELQAIRKRVNSRGPDALTAGDAFFMEKQFILNNLRDNIQDEFDTARYESTQTTGPDSSTNAARARLQSYNITAAEQSAIDVLDSVLDRYLQLDIETRLDFGGSSQNYLDAIDRYQFKYYSPQWVKDKEHDNTFDIGQGVFDPLMSTHDTARGTVKETTSPTASILSMVGRTFHDRADNQVKENVFALWAAAQNENVSGAVGADMADATLTMVDKRSKKYDKLMSSAQKNVFILHLNEQSQEMIDAVTPAEINKALSGSPSNYAMVLTYRKPTRKKAGSKVPEMIKGVREKNSVVTHLRESDNVLANIATGGARVTGSMHTKYDPAWPVIQLMRDTLAAFVTVGANEGFAGLHAFTNEGLGSVMAIAPKMADYLYNQERPGAAAAAKIAALESDPELREFMDFINGGAPTPFARSISLNNHMDELAEGLRTRGLTPTELQALQDVDRVIALFSSMTDTVGRYATYKAYRARGYSKQQAASEARGIADFAQRGQSQYAELGGMMYMFYRSGMIGATQMIDTLLDSRYNLETLGIATGVASGMFATAAMMSPVDEEGNNLFLTQGSSTTHFKVFIGEDSIVQIPYAYNGFVAAAAATVQGLYGLSGNQSFAETASNIVDIMINNVTPVSNNIGFTDDQGNLDMTQVSKKLFDLAAPTLANPFLGLAMNVNNFGSPIVPQGGSISDPGSIGESLDSTGSQIGTVAELLSRTLSNATGITPSVRQVSYLLNEMANGPTAVADAALEWFRLGTGRDYKANWKRAAVPFAGVIGTPYNSQNEKYYSLWNKLSDIDRSRRILIRSGLTEEQAEQQITDIVGPEVMRDIALFDERNAELQSSGTELRDLRLSQVLSSSERITEYREKLKAHNAKIGAIIRSIEAA